MIIFIVINSRSNVIAYTRSKFFLQFKAFHIYRTRDYDNLYDNLIRIKLKKKKLFDLKQTCKWKHFSSYTSISVSMLHFLKNIYQHFLSFTSFSASVLYFLKNIHQHFSSHTSVFVSMLRFLRNLHIFQQLDYLKNFLIF
jgi:hypothetical protein